MLELNGPELVDQMKLIYVSLIWFGSTFYTIMQLHRMLGRFHDKTAIGNKKESLFLVAGDNDRSNSLCLCRLNWQQDTSSSFTSVT